MGDVIDEEINGLRSVYCKDMVDAAILYLVKGGIREQNLVDRLWMLGYFHAPASKGHHLNKAGGLLEHSVNVTRRLSVLSDALCVHWPRRESPYLVGMLHDLVKCQCYRLRKDGDKDAYEYVQPAWPGHGVASVMIATVELGVKLEPMEAAAIIHHMGAFGLSGRDLNEFDAALDEFAPAIIATHTADWAAARIDEEGCFHDQRAEVPVE